MKKHLEKKQPQLLEVGRTGRPYGIKGWMKIHSFTEPDTKMLEYAPWFVLLRGEQFSLEACRQHGAFLIGKIKDIHTPEEAKRFTNLSILITKTKLPKLPKNEYYWAELLAIEVYNLENHYLGCIESFMETGANDVMIVRRDHQKILIPYVKGPIVQEIDLVQKKMIVDWQEDWL